MKGMQNIFQLDLIRRSFAISAMAAMLLLFAGNAVFAQSSDKNAEKMKAKITKIGTGKSARIKLQLRNGSRISGYVSEIKDRSFVLVSDQSGASTEIEYADAKPAPWKAPKALVIAFAAATVLGVTLLAGLIGNARGE
jgi:hypothetical protein